MTCSNPCIAFLRDRGYRLTPQRLAILRILREAGEHLTPAEVFQQAHQVVPGMTEATVYRTLNFFAEHGLAFPTQRQNGQLVYESAEHDHHHLVCRACGKTLEIEHAALQPLYERFQISTGYQIDFVHLTFFGLCPACQAE
jgi:Fur family transcriptional regulator, ferric uptake regulator